MNFDVAQGAGIATAILAAIGTIVAKYLDHRTKELNTRVSSEIEMREALLRRIDTLEARVAMATNRELELMQQSHKLERALSLLEIRYEALKENHAELSDRYKLAEQANAHLRDQLLKWYLEAEARRTAPPPI